MKIGRTCSKPRPRKGGMQSPADLSRALLDSLTDAVLHLDEQGRLLNMNAAAERMFGFALHDMHRQPICWLLPDNACAGQSCLKRRCRLLQGLTALGDGAERLSWQAEGQHRRNGKFPIEIQLNSLAQDEGEGYVAVVRELRERLSVEAKLKQAVLEKVQLEARYRAKSQFIANMNHELRTPLNAILGYAELLQEAARAKGVDEMVDDLAQVHQAGRHMLEIVNEILDLAKIEAGHMALNLDWFEVHSLVEQAITTVMPLAANNGNHLSYLGEPYEGLIFADLTKIRQILFNLIGNACKFTHDGAISLSVLAEARDGVEGLLFAVSDTGIGMSQAQIEHLFEPFAQADASIGRSYGGTGLGLSISKVFCEMMGGSIGIASTPGEGSTFSVWLPREVQPKPAPLKAEPRPVNNEQAVRVREGSKEQTDQRKRVSTILTIEDDPVLSELVAHLLVSEGYRAVTARNGEDGLRLIGKIRPDAILLDVMMPDMDGWAVLKEIKRAPELAAIPVIMLSILDDKGLAFALGASDYINKPVDRMQLLDTLAKWLRHDHPHRIMLMGQDQELRLDLTLRFKEEGFAVELPRHARHALQCLDRRQPALFLLDAAQPEEDWIRVLDRVAEHEAMRQVPFVAFTDGIAPHPHFERIRAHASRVIDRGGMPSELLWEDLRAGLDRMMPPYRGQA